MKRFKRLNLLMHTLVIIAIILLATTMTMALLIDQKHGKKNLVFGKVAISGENSLLELDIEETVTLDTDVLNIQRYLYFSPTIDT